MSYSVGLTVRPTEEVIRIIEAAMEANDYVLLQLFNYAAMQSYTPNGDEWEHSNDFARAYLHGHVYRVGASETKSFRFVEVDQSNRRVVLQTGATVAAHGTICCPWA